MYFAQTRDFTSGPENSEKPFNGSSKRDETARHKQHRQDQQDAEDNALHVRPEIRGGVDPGE
jgi:hypothetical protein